MNNSFSSKILGRGCNPTMCDNSDMFMKTQDNLALTPSDVKRCVENGIPVSVSNASMFIDGVENPSTVLPVDELRGVDIVDTWEASRTAKAKLIKAHLNDVMNYGS